jgi:hypothetical protein
MAFIPTYGNKASMELMGGLFKLETTYNDKMENGTVYMSLKLINEGHTMKLTVIVFIVVTISERCNVVMVEDGSGREEKKRALAKVPFL